MKTFPDKKLIIALAALMCISSVKSQIPGLIKNLPYFKQRTSMLALLHKSHPTGRLNIMNCSLNAPCLSAQKTLGGTREDYVYTMIPTHDGGFAIVGGTNSGDGDFKVPASN